MEESYWFQENLCDEMDGLNPFPEGGGGGGGGGTVSSMSEDPIVYSALMNIDSFTEPCNTATADQMFSQYNYLNAQQNFPAVAAAAGQRKDWASTGCGDFRHSSSLPSSTEKNSVMQDVVMGAQDLSAPRDLDITCTDARSNSLPSLNMFDDNDELKRSVPRSLAGISLEERLLRAMSFLMKSSGGGILVQVWMPFKQEDGYLLSTSDQPYLLDQILSGYREVSRTYTFSGKDTPRSIFGLPGRVFISGLPEWTSNIVYYNQLEYLRMEHAINYKICGSLALPIFEQNGCSCRAVLELVTNKEKPDFDMEIANVRSSLQAVNLRSDKANARQQNLKMCQRSAFAEILDVLRSTCHAHMLPLALTWLPLSYSIDEDKSELTAEKETILCIQESACYVHDQGMHGFLHACSENRLQTGQGTAGKAINSSHPVFSSDVRMFSVHQYPLAHHARKFGLHASVAIRLRSTFTGDDDYILEFFLPINCKGSTEQQLLLNNLSITMHKICRSLRTVSDTKIVGSDNNRLNISQTGMSSQPIDLTKRNNISMQCGYNSTSSGFMHKTNLDKQIDDGPHNWDKSRSSRRRVKGHSKAEKSINLSILQQYYSGTLKEAAKRIGVCPTTLKKICRQNGISRWPSRKINKVNHSVEKIQKVMDSVPGVNGAIKYDHVRGTLIAEVSSQRKEATKTPLESASSVDVSMHSDEHAGSKQFTGTCGGPTYKLPLCQAIDSADQSEPPDHEQQISPGRPPEYSITGICTSKRNDASNSIRIIGHGRQPCSSTTDTSSSSASSDPTLTQNKKADPLINAENDFSVVSVKATYKEDVVRFKFSPCMGCHQLFEEISKRFRLLTGTFQVKYKDDEDEWILLANDSDLLESLEILESTESRNVRLLVRDLPSAIGSSGSSNSLLMGTTGRSSY